MIQQIQSNKAPAAVGPYSQVVIANEFVFLSGMLPLDRETEEIVGLNAAEQTNQIMKNISGLLSELHLRLEDVVKTTIFLDSIETFQSVNEVYGSYFTTHKPARSCVEVAAIPKGALIEIEVIAIKK
ncbi:2-iminobutanoate/2-iminopropanoate deaminase [Scopulibacillus darangshiensis]|uniref:2-iminobutanoate/2-iminopropanoate deaminase n=1 Tax=Scopulibacillus darangshiensis TaxID=442528 RepID=A0A4R2NSJ3_9BACL|nr:RidA family protein [Scopulibacillus darangshiensis]TCP24913.1 2-iminobutanoate/2-iminopropanoate deaminase [Scopulibacillus darangshiensis]